MQNRMTEDRLAQHKLAIKAIRAIRAKAGVELTAEDIKTIELVEALEAERKPVADLPGLMTEDRLQLLKDAFVPLAKAHHHGLPASVGYQTAEEILDALQAEKIAHAAANAHLSTEIGTNGDLKADIARLKVACLLAKSSLQLAIKAASCPEPVTGLTPTGGFVTTGSYSEEDKP